MQTGHKSLCGYAILYSVRYILLSMSAGVVTSERGRHTTSASATSTNTSSGSQTSAPSAPTTTAASATAAPTTASATRPRHAHPLSADAPVFVPRAPGANNNGRQFIVRPLCRVQFGLPRLCSVVCTVVSRRTLYTPVVAVFRNLESA